MTITITLSNADEMEILRVANELHVTPKKITQKLKNIYLANLSDDLGWVAEMVQEDKEQSN